MIKNRLNEISDFIRSESPYRSASKGWINNDVYIKWGYDKDYSPQKNNQILDVSIFWKPFNRIFSYVLAVLFFASCLCLADIFLDKNDFGLGLGGLLDINTIEKVQNKFEPINDDIALAKTESETDNSSLSLLEKGVAIEELEENIKETESIKDNAIKSKSNQLSTSSTKGLNILSPKAS